MATMGRIETRTATVSTDIDWLQKDHQWPNLAAIGKVTRTRAFKTKTSIETVLYLLSTPLTAIRLNEVALIEESRTLCIGSLMSP